MLKNVLTSKHRPILFFKHLVFIRCFFLYHRTTGKFKGKGLKKMSFTYKEQYAVIVICKDEEDQKDIYNRLKEEGYKLKVVAV